MTLKTFVHFSSLFDLVPLVVFWAWSMVGWWGALAPVSGELPEFRQWPVWPALSAQWWPVTSNVAAKPLLTPPGRGRDRRPPALIVVHPHGQFGTGMLMGCVLGSPTGCFGPTQSAPLVVAHPSVFWCPLLRHVASWLGCIPADPALIRRYLEGHEGRDIIIAPGSISEDLRPPGSILARRGWIRAVAGTRAWIVPVHVATLDRPMYRMYLTHGPILSRLNQWAYRWLRFPAPSLAWGWRWFPMWPAPTRLLVHVRPEPIQAVVGLSEEEIYARVYGDFYGTIKGTRVVTP